MASPSGNNRIGFHIIDYAIFVLTLLVSLGIGVYFALKGGGQKTSGQFFLAERKMKVFPVSVSILVTFISATGILGIPAEMFFYGTGYSMSMIAMGLGCTYAAILFVPVYYPLKLTSTFEYLRLRFHSQHLQRFGSVLSMTTSLFYTGIGLYAPSVALRTVSGTPVWMSITISGVISTIYTAIGGITAVIWTDVFQGAVLLGGLVTIVVLGVLKVGGLNEVWRLNNEWDRIRFLDFDPNPIKRSSFWSVVVMMSVLWMCIGVSQPTVQRYCALPSMKQAKVSLFINIPGFILSTTLTSMAGVVAFAYYAQGGCNPLSSGEISNANEILPYFVADIAGYPGIMGLFVACLYSAALSSASSAYNAVAAIIWEDFLKEFFTDISEQRKTFINKFLVMLCGAASIGIAFVAQGIGGTFIQILYTICGALAGPIVGVFFLAAFVPKSGRRAALIGGYISLGVSLWISINGYILGYHMTVLPLPEENCTAPGFIANTSSAGLENSVNMSYATESYVDDSYATTVHAYTSTEKELHGVEYLYAISYFWYPSIGISIVLLIGIVSSCIPGLREDREVPIKYISPLVRPCHRHCNIDASEEFDYVIDYRDHDGDVHDEKLKNILELPESNIAADVRKTPLLQKHLDEVQSSCIQPRRPYTSQWSTTSSTAPLTSRGPPAYQRTLKETTSDDEEYFYSTSNVNSL